MKEGVDQSIKHQPGDTLKAGLIQPAQQVLHPTYSPEMSVNTGARSPGPIEFNAGQIYLGGTNHDRATESVLISLEGGEVSKVRRIQPWETQIHLGGGAYACFRFDDLTVVDRQGKKYEFPGATKGDNLAVDAFRVADGEVVFRAGNTIKHLKMNASGEVTIESPMRDGTVLSGYDNFIGLAQNEKVILTGWDNGAKVTILERGDDGKYSLDKGDVSPGLFTIYAADILPDGRLVTAVSTDLQINTVTDRKPDWNYEFKSKTRELLDRDIFSLAVSADSGIVCGHRNGEVTVLRPNQSRTAWIPETLSGHKGAVDSVRILRDGRIISADRKGVVTVWS